MQPYLDITIVLLLLFTGWQDFSSRAISPWPLLTVFMLLVFRGAEIMGLKATFIISGTNLLLLATELLFIFLYIKLKKGKHETVMDKYLGWGDVVFLVAIIPAFFPFSFMIFLISSLFLIIFFYFIFSVAKIKHNHLIPLAGILSVFFALVLLIEHASGINLTHKTSFSFNNYSPTTIDLLSQPDNFLNLLTFLTFITR